MSQKSEQERIAHKAHEIWESEGRPHGREQAHWDQAKEIVALHDSMGDTLLPRDTGAAEPEESIRTATVNGDIPGLTDQGRDDLNDIDREPEVTKPSQRAAAKTIPAAAAEPAEGEAVGSSKSSGKAAKPAASEVEAKPEAKTDDKAGSKPAPSKAAASKVAASKSPAAKPVAKGATKGQPTAGKR